MANAGHAPVTSGAGIGFTQIWFDGVAGYRQQ